MSKMAELDAALTTLADLSTSMLDVIRSMRELFTAEPETETASEPAEPAPKVYTIEEVRALLLQKRRDGFRNEVKALLTAHGAERLTDIDPGEYAAMMKEAEAIGA